MIIRGVSAVYLTWYSQKVVQILLDVSVDALVDVSDVSDVTDVLDYFLPLTVTAVNLATVMMQWHVFIVQQFFLTP